MIFIFHETTNALGSVPVSRFVLFDLIPYVPVNNFSVMLGRVFLG